MTYYEQLEILMQKMQYHKCAKSINCLRFYINGIGYDTKVIVLASDHIITYSIVEHLYNQIPLIFGCDIPKERILIVSYNNGSCVRKSNVIKLTSKGIKGYTSDLFLTEMNYFKKCILLTEEKRERAMILYPDYSYHQVIMTVLLIVINVITFFTNYKIGSINIEKLGISEQTVIGNRENIRLLTYMFMHNSIIHLLVNIFGLYMIGKQLERNIGAIRMLGIYICTGLLGGMLSVSLSGTLLGKENVITTGASGAIYGMLGALIVVQCMTCEKRFISLTKTSIFYLLVLSLGFLRPNVDNLCHIGGFVTGIVFMTVIELLDTNKRYNSYQKLTKNINRRELEINGYL